MAKVMQRDTVSVQLEHGCYEITIGANLLADTRLWQGLIPSGKAVIVSNEAVANHYLSPLSESIQAAGGTPAHFFIQDGERYKTLDTFASALDFLVQMKAGRDISIVALGGGVVGDVAGFVAACYMRGVNLIQVPTTLLAQVDSSVGGKTGVNHSLGKNLIGAFHQPTAVVADTDTLNTLAKREYLCGLAEVVKYGLIADAAFFQWLEREAASVVTRKQQHIQTMVKKSCEHKAKIVAADEREQGVRAWLNLGHTFAHAIESLTGYQRYLHGEAVSIGLVQAAFASVHQRTLVLNEALRVRRLLKRLGLPVDMPNELTTEAVWESMQRDKKNRDDQVRMILLHGIGRAYVCKQASKELIHAARQASSEFISA